LKRVFQEMDDTPDIGAAKPEAAASPAAARLKRALRENLKRRKAQARARHDAAAAPSQDTRARREEGGGEEPGE
jgi:hypothetical protein